MPIFAANSTWQTTYNRDRSQLTDNGKNTADSITDAAYQAATAGSKTDRDAALQTAQANLSQMSGALGEDNAAVKDLTALVDKAQFENDKMSHAGLDTLEGDANKALATIFPIDNTEALSLRSEAASAISAISPDEGAAFGQGQSLLLQTGGPGGNVGAANATLGE